MGVYGAHVGPATVDSGDESINTILFLFGFKSGEYRYSISHTRSLSELEKNLEKSKVLILRVNLQHLWSLYQLESGQSISGYVIYETYSYGQLLFGSCAS